MIGIMRVSVCLGAILIPEYLDFHSGYSAPSGRNMFRNIPNERALRCLLHLSFLRQETIHVRSQYNAVFAYLYHLRS